MLFTTLSRLINESFEDELERDPDLPGRAEEPLLEQLDARAMAAAMRDPDRSLDEQDAILTAVVICYRKAPTPAWSALLLEMLSPTLVASSIRFPYSPRAVDEEDVQQQVIVEALHAARFMRIPEPGFTLNDLIETTVKRTARMLMRATRAEGESLEQSEEEPGKRLDSDEVFLAELAWGNEQRADLALVYLSKVRRMTAREIAIELGVSMDAIRNWRRRARRHLDLNELLAA
jgi:DNA-directed RNA polymerase specialized sigma24 family protein